RSLTAPQLAIGRAMALAGKPLLIQRAVFKKICCGLTVRILRSEGKKRRNDGQAPYFSSRLSSITRLVGRLKNSSALSPAR
ncbi:MAG: hypothetical protein ABI039_15065, partial [Vicinamibacterales bacterium]